MDIIYGIHHSKPLDLRPEALLFGKLEFGHFDRDDGGGG